MLKKPVLYASLASIALVGCATTQSTRLTQQDCTGGNCKVDITITGNCEFGVPDTLLVKLPFGRKKIEWEIQSQAYIFAANGIVFKRQNSVFEQPELSPSGKKFKWDDRHETSGLPPYEYAINVIKTGPNPGVCTKDPFIVNE